MNSTWTLVSDKLPTQKSTSCCEYIVTLTEQRDTKKRWISEALYIPNDPFYRWTLFGESGHYPEMYGWKVIAWMPKPKYPPPYEGAL